MSKNKQKTTLETVSKTKPRTEPKSVQKKDNRGKVYKGQTKYIDKEPKRTRRYVIVQDNGTVIGVAKLKSIKKVDANNKNTDLHLVEINHKRYKLPDRTGVDSEVFNQNLMSKKDLTLKKDDRAFLEDAEFELGSSDKYNVLRHTKSKGKNKRDKK